MIIDSNSNDILMTSLTWEQFTISNNINEIFSHIGINDYTKQSRSKRRYSTQSYTNIYNVHDIISDEESFRVYSIGNEHKNWKYDSKDNNIKFPSLKHRIILNSPFLTTIVVSYGLKVYAKDTKRWAIVQNKHTVEFLLIIRGLYRPTFTYFLLSRITPNECIVVKKCLTENILTFTHLFLNELMFDKDGLLYALVRMAESRDIILKIIESLDLSNNKLDWCWPKGRLLISAIKETTFECAKREFHEEVDIVLPPPIYVSTEVITEFHTTVTGRKIESKYWIYAIANEIPMPKLNEDSNSEVNNRLWVSTELCYDLIPNTKKYKHIFDEIMML